MLRSVAFATGHEVKVFERAEPALEAVFEHPTELVVFDTASEERDPLRWARRFREASAAQLIVLTSRARDLKRLRSHADALSIAAVLTRSTPASALQTFVQRLLLAPRPVVQLRPHRQRYREWFQRQQERAAETAPAPQDTRGV